MPIEATPGSQFVSHCQEDEVGGNPFTARCCGQGKQGADVGGGVGPQYCGDVGNDADRELVDVVDGHGHRQAIVFNPV